MILDNFIAFEGIDGTGTTTQISLLAQRREAKRFYLTAEPTKGCAGILLRQILGGKITVAPSTAAFLFAADRNEHIYGAGGIMENLRNGKAVVTDRYVFSNIAYQSVDCGMELPEMLNSTFPLPRIVFYFSLDPESALNRIKNRDTSEIYEKSDFLKKTSAAYDAIIKRYMAIAPDIDIVRIDASLPVEKIAEIIWGHIANIPILKA